MRNVITLLLVLSIAGSAYGQATATPRSAQSTEKTEEKAASDPTRSAEGTPVPNTSPRSTISSQKKWYQHRDTWLVIGSAAGLAAGGGYLVSRDGTGKKVGGAAMIGVGVVLVCVPFIRGCSR